MAGLSIIIPSRNVSNLATCIQAVRKHEPQAHIIVVDDGIDWRLMPVLPGTPPQYQTCAGRSPFIFARNVNIGIQAAGTDDVILLNDDAILESPDGFNRMQRAAKSWHEIGLISATTNYAANPEQQRYPTRGLRYCSSPFVAFVCVLIPRRTIETVGLLDERFTGYGWEDNDYCRRVSEAGFKLAIHDGCFVDHLSLTSTFRGSSFPATAMAEGQKLYLEKWRTM